MLDTSDLIDGADSFTIYTPGVVDIIEKANAEEERPIGGFCSTQRRDRQEEIVLAKGLDFSEFLAHGYFNDNHKQDTHAALGWPDVVELRKSRWWTEGKLVKGYPPADKVWDLAKALKKSNAPRRLGFSIEGKVLERGLDNKIVRANIRHVAITNSPVNTDCTWDTLTKAFGCVEQVDAVLTRKAMSASYQSPGASAGAALQSESIEDEDLIDLSFDDAVKRVKKAWPMRSWAACEETTRLIFKLEERKR
jgi:hypothetical protein